MPARLSQLVVAAFGTENWTTWALNLFYQFRIQHRTQFVYPLNGLRKVGMRFCRQTLDSLRFTLSLFCVPQWLPTGAQLFGHVDASACGYCFKHRYYRVYRRSTPDLPANTDCTANICSSCFFVSDAVPLLSVLRSRPNTPPVNGIPVSFNGKGALLLATM